MPTPTEHPVAKLPVNLNQSDVSGSFDKLNIPGLINGG